MAKKIIVDINERWEQDLPHYDKSYQIYKRIAELDCKYNEDANCFKAGGDGDNGEDLMYFFDILIEEGLISNT